MGIFAYVVGSLTKRQVSHFVWKREERSAAWFSPPPPLSQNILHITRNIGERDSWRKEQLEQRMDTEHSEGCD